MTRLVAFTCGRNVETYVEPLVASLREQGVPLVFIDDGSFDDTPDIAEGLVGRGVSRVVHLPYDGRFSMERQLDAKRSLVLETDCDWVLSVDADEIIEHREPGRGLHDIVAEAEANGDNAVNFDEFVFLPCPGEDFTDGSHLRMRRHYFHDPWPDRLMRLWRRGFGFNNVATGGHQLSGLAGCSLHPVTHSLRHYMVLSQEHAEAKYLGRVYDPGEIARDWHTNRLDVTARGLLLPGMSDPRPSWTARPGSRDLDRTRPVSRHYWRWPGRPALVGPAADASPPRDPRAPGVG